MHNPQHAERVGPAAPDAATKDDALTVASSQGADGVEQDASPDFHCTGLAQQATLTITGELIAGSYLDRLRDGTAQPSELSALLCYLRGELLHGACRLIEKTLEGLRHA